MSLRSLEKAIWTELKVVLNNPKIRLKDMLEWSTHTIHAAEEGEIVLELKDPAVFVCVKAELDKRGGK